MSSTSRYGPKPSAEAKPCAAGQGALYSKRKYAPAKQAFINKKVKKYLDDGVFVPIYDVSETSAALAVAEPNKPGGFA
jgi:hypothetical protein